MGNKKVVLVYGTRPEFIKLISLVQALRKTPKVELLVVNTGQHRELVSALEQVLGLYADLHLDVMAENQNPNHVLSKTVALFDEVIQKHQPDVVLVQGDTTTVLAVGICCFNRQVAVGHVEAGLRSFNMDSPFPEEFNRRTVSMIASYHFAPTALAMKNLEQEGVPKEKLFLTGNTVIDALKYIDEQLIPKGTEPQHSKTILVTAHRRENYGVGIQQISAAVADLANSFPNFRFTWPVHPNPNIHNVVYGTLGNIDNVELIEPMSYLDLVCYMKSVHLILTDSGGIQEEAPYFKKPVIILREETERPEVLHAGFGILVGANKEKIVNAVTTILNDPASYAAMITGENPFGDGRAAERIVKTILA
jgi:UDP-N-acetylglucosamine 2-epimerase (non-hydrolysing)